MRKFLPILVLLCTSAPAFADAPGILPSPNLPDSVRQMIDTALASGNEADIAAVARIAKRTNPTAAAEVDAIVNAYQQQKTEKTQETIREAGLFDLWSGRGELGGYRSTGTSSEVGISASLSLKRIGLHWTHNLRANADYRRSNGATTGESVLAAYEPNYKFDPNSYIYGLMQYEHDPFLGYYDRYTLSTGMGYQFLHTPRVKLAATAGPSVRHVSYTDGTAESKLGLRSSLDMSWKLSPTLTFSQTASGYGEQNVVSISALSAFDARIFARLSARLSYNVKYESQTPLTNKSHDTLSRVTLVYDF